MVWQYAMNIYLQVGVCNNCMGPLPLQDVDKLLLFYKKNVFWKKRIANTIVRWDNCLFSIAILRLSFSRRKSRIVWMFIFIMQCHQLGQQPNWYRRLKLRRQYMWAKSKSRQQHWCYVKDQDRQVHHRQTFFEAWEHRHNRSQEKQRLQPMDQDHRQD